MALYAIGDVHGCARTLDALLDALAQDADGTLGPKDTLVFVGDYVDRGPDSPGVIDRLIALEHGQAAGTGPRCVFLRGNHDQMMLDYADGTGDTELWWVNGGRTTLAAYHNRGDLRIPPDHIGSCGGPSSPPRSMGSRSSMRVWTRICRSPTTSPIPIRAS